MPYIELTARKVINQGGAPVDAGELNFTLTAVVRRYIENMGLSYKTINDILGALEGAKLEFYRRVVAPYENMKASQNGDIYGEQVKEIILKWQGNHTATLQVKENNG